MSTLGNKFLLLSNDKKVVQDIILCGIWILCLNSLPWVEKLLVDGDLCSNAIAKSFVSRHDHFIMAKNCSKGQL
jgi:hypothetical protein